MRRFIGSCVVIALGMLAFTSAGCDPAWMVHVDLRDSNNVPIEGATLAVACSAESFQRGTGFAVKTDSDGVARIGSIGASIPVGCDVYIVRRDMEPLRIPYRELCPNARRGCQRVFSFALVAERCESPGACGGFDKRLLLHGGCSRLESDVYSKPPRIESRQRPLDCARF